MGYTKTLAGLSKIVSITGTAQTLEDLLGAAVDADIVNRVELHFIGSIVGVSPVAWYEEDGSTPAPDNARPLYAGGVIEITRLNFSTFKIIKDSGGNFNMWSVQFDHEQETT